MRTNIDLNVELIEEAMRHAPVRTKKDMVHLALEEFVANHRRRDVRELLGKVKIRPDYDHKPLRERAR